MSEMKLIEKSNYGNSETISCAVFYEFDDVAINRDEIPQIQPPADKITPVPVAE
jgi:hypothetical protein